MSYKTDSEFEKALYQGLQQDYQPNTTGGAVNDTVTDVVAASFAEAHALANRVSKLADKMFGAQPENANVGHAMPPSSGGIMNAARDAARDVIRDCNRANEALDRIESQL